MSTYDAQAEKLKAHLLALARNPGNSECADCSSRSVKWAAFNHGIFICIKCSGIHRSLGREISKVKSLTLDKWLPDQVSQMVGNLQANNFYLYNLPPNKQKPNENDDAGRERWIKDKYVKRLWVKRPEQPDRQVPIAQPSAVQMVSPASMPSLSATPAIQVRAAPPEPRVQMRAQPQQPVIHQAYSNQTQSSTPPVSQPVSQEELLAQVQRQQQALIQQQQLYQQYLQQMQALQAAQTQAAIKSSTSMPIFSNSSSTQQSSSPQFVTPPVSVQPVSQAVPQTSGPTTPSNTDDLLDILDAGMAGKPLTATRQPAVPITNNMDMFTAIGAPNVYQAASFVQSETQQMQSYAAQHVATQNPTQPKNDAFDWI